MGSRLVNLEVIFLKISNNFDMGPLRIAINGFGRMGRVLTRVIWDNPAFDVVAINSRSGCDIYAHLLKYDSIYNRWNNHEVTHDSNDAIVVDGKRIQFYHEDDLSRVPWRGQNIDLVIESTGVYRDRESSEKHLKNGVKYVLITAPAKKEDKTLIYNINHTEFDPEKHKILSAASCTTTCLAPVAKIIHEHFGIKHGVITTTHAYTNDQHLVDYPHEKNSFRRARAAAMSIIPTSTGAAQATAKVIPALEGKLDGNALRVPVAVPSIISFIAEVEKSTTKEEVNQIFFEEKKNYPGSLDVSDVGLVSIDYIGSPYGATVDTLSTSVIDGTMIFMQAWYDNEWGYVTQMSKLLEYLGTRIT